jgi:hypothetical protein
MYQRNSQTLHIGRIRMDIDDNSRVTWALNKTCKIQRWYVVTGIDDQIQPPFVLSTLSLYRQPWYICYMYPSLGSALQPTGRPELNAEPNES